MCTFFYLRISSQRIPRLKWFLSCNEVGSCVSLINAPSTSHIILSHLNWETPFPNRNYFWGSSLSSNPPPPPWTHERGVCQSHILYLAFLPASRGRGSVPFAFRIAFTWVGKSRTRFLWGERKSDWEMVQILADVTVPVLSSASKCLLANWTAAWGECKCHFLLILCCCCLDCLLCGRLAKWQGGVWLSTKPNQTDSHGWVELGVGYSLRSQFSVSDSQI